MTTSYTVHYNLNLPDFRMGPWHDLINTNFVSIDNILWTNRGIPEAPLDAFLYGRTNAAWARAVPLAGGTMTGLLTLSANPSAALGAATKQYVDAADAALSASKVSEAPNDGKTYGRKSLTWLDLATLYQPLDGDLTAIAALGGTNTIYYRSAANTWSPVVIGANLTFSGGTLSGSASGIADAPSDGKTYGRLNATWTDLALGTTYQPLDGDLTAIAALSGTNTIYYRSAANTWSPVTIGTNLSFSGGTLSSTGGISDAPNDTKVYGRTALSWTDLGLLYQPLDGDLTSIAALTGTNTIYYRSGTNIWSPVTVGSNMTFAGGVLNSGGSPPGGADTQVQFNDAGAFGGDATFTYDKTNKRLAVSGITSTASFAPNIDMGIIKSGAVHITRLATPTLSLTTLGDAGRGREGVAVRSTGSYSWTPTTSDQVPDTAVLRASAAVVKIEGTPGVLGDISVRKAILAADPANPLEAATKQYVDAAVSVSGAPINSPTFTGDPKAPTPPTIDNDTSIATTAFVKAAIAAGAGASGIPEAPSDGLYYGRINGAWGSVAPLAGPSFTGPISVDGATNSNTTVTINANTNAYGLAILSPSTNANGSGISFVSGIGGTQRTGSFSQDSAGNMVFRQSAGSMYYDFSSAVNFRDSGFVLRTSIDSTGLTAVGKVAVNAAAPNLYLNKTASANACTAWGQTNGSARWGMQLASNTSESGADVGSDFVLQRYSDAGVLIATALTINRKTGDITAGGSITLPANPTLALQAATKQYVDSAAGPPPATVAPLMDGAAAVGTTTKYAREDHVHPTDTNLKASIVGSASSGFDTLGEIENYIAANITPALGNKADLASPTFTGDPKAPTATAGDSDTSIATTAFVQQEIASHAVRYDAVQSLTSPQQAQARANIGVTAGGSSIICPVGVRISLASNASVMTTNVSGGTAIYCLPHLTNQLPVWDGSAWTVVNVGSSGINQNLTDATKSPAATVASGIYDLFVWNDAGTTRLSRGAAWANATTRTTTLTRQDGVWTNAQAITNGPAIGKGTWLGTFYSSTGNLAEWRLGAVAAGGSLIQLSLWNAYNRCVVAAMNGDSSSTWTYNSAAWRQANASVNNSARVISGAPDDAIQAIYSTTMSSTANGDVPGNVGIGIDSTTANSGSSGVGATDSASTGRLDCSAIAHYMGYLAAGSHAINAIEASTGANTVSFNPATSNASNRMIVRMMM